MPGPALLLRRTSQAPCDVDLTGPAHLASECGGEEGCSVAEVGGARRRADGITLQPSVAQFPVSARPGEAAELDDLLRAVAGGDQVAFDNLYRLLAPKVFGLTHRVLRDPVHAEEVTQEVLLEVWLLAARFDAKRGRAVTWVLTMAYRRAVDRVRAERAACARLRGVGIASLDVAYDHVACEAIRRLDRHRLRACLPALTGLQRQAITLAFYDGHTYSEVAGILGIPVATVKSRMRDALIRLRECLGVETPAN